MSNPYNLLENVLTNIEENIRDNINLNNIAEKHNLSSRHLQRLFKMTFNQPLGSYIRSRKLATSIDDLLNTNSNILNVALNYDFEYEQSYIRSFKCEYGITPGDLRKTRKILKITPPLNLFHSTKYSDGIMFGPEIVIIPQFHVIGKNSKISFRDSNFAPHKIYENFISCELKKIKNVINPNVKISVSRTAGGDADYSFFMPAIQVKNLEYIPEGLDHFTFETSICAKFRFVGKDNNEKNMHVADEMYKTIDNFMDDENQKYFLERKKMNIDIFDRLDIEDGYYLWEWFAPVIKKSSMEILPFSPSGIKKVLKQKLPSLRFIGKKFNNKPKPEEIYDLLAHCQLKNIFYDIEKQSNINYKTFFEGGDAYISLIKKNNEDIFEHWMGMFMPEGTEVPQGYEALDFPKMTIGVCRVYGKKSEIINYDAECRNKLTEEGINFKNEKTSKFLFFRRFNWHRFFEDDMYGKRLLDYCYLVM